MPGTLSIFQKITALLVYGRPFLVFGGMISAIIVVWNQSPAAYVSGVIFLILSMIFDLIDDWFASRYPPHNPNLTNLVERVMDKVVYSIIFPLVAVGMMWRLIFVYPDHARGDILHAILVLLLCITVLVRDNFAHFIRGYASDSSIEYESRDFTRLRTMVAAPVGALLYIHAFYLPDGASSGVYSLISDLAHLPLRIFFIIEIVFLIINFGSIAGLCRRYGTHCLDDICHEDDMLRRRILSFLPNSLTFMNAMMGLLAVFFAYQGRIKESFLFLLGSAIFDKLDGALARKLGLTEPPLEGGSPTGITFGGILDDIADAVSFCFSPAIIFYLIFTRVDEPLIANLPYGVVALFYFCMGIARLIYFTLDRAPIPGFFKGMPTPAAALLVTATLLIFSQTAEESANLTRLWGMISFAIMIIAGLVMNFYPIHYLHFGRFMDRNALFSRLNILVLLIFLFTPYFGHISLFYLLLYLLSPAVTWKIEPKRESPELSG